MDSKENLVVQYEYTAYGKISSITGSLANTVGVYNPFRYKGYYYDKETGVWRVPTKNNKNNLVKWTSDILYN